MSRQIGIAPQDGFSQGGSSVARANSHNDPLADLNGVDAPASTATTEVLTVGDYVFGVSADDDRDWYRIELVAGQEYTFSTTSYDGNHLDTTLYLRNASGGVIDFDDDSGPGLDALITFTPSSSGVYYLDVGVFGGFGTVVYGLTAQQTINEPDTVPGNTSTGASLAIGGFVDGTLETPGDEDWYAVTLEAGQSYLFTLDAQGSPPLGDPYLRLYNSSGVQVAFDDDGGAGLNSAMRYTPATSGVYYVSAEAFSTENGRYRLSADAVPPQDPLDAIDWGTSLGDNTVQIYFATFGQSFGAYEATQSWAPAQEAAALAAFASISEYVNITFVEVGNSNQADFILILDEDLSAIGRFDTPPTSPALGVFAPDPVYLSGNSLLPGGAAFSSMLHEFGHGMGLAHPHDGGGSSEVLEGVSSPFDSYGAFDLNQGVFTVMSYNDGWLTGPSGGPTGYSAGYAATLMALDLAVLQARYGATERNTDDTTYTLGDDSFIAIWDTGGVDTIRVTGMIGATIDLRAATLLLEDGGGGWVSYLSGVNGGFTIANGVVIENASGAGGNDVLIGNEFDNRLIGNGGNDDITGGGGMDTGVLFGARSDFTVSVSGSNATFTGFGQTDSYHGVELFEFYDRTAALIDFGGDYLPFMSAIRDFDGNDLGGAEGWELIGSVDVQGDDDIEYVLFNSQIGRWATVGVASDGLVYFDDHSWGGDTRVVGIYIDPLVESGDVVAGSDHDSQRRFQNDLFIDNIAGILGAADYNDDGLQEIYFSLTDGTAYLHAYMHADGNIQYANYQNQQQVIDFLTDNGWSSDTWDGWFPGGAGRPVASADEADIMLVAAPLPETAEYVQEFPSYAERVVDKLWTDVSATSSEWRDDLGVDVATDDFVLL